MRLTDNVQIEMRRLMEHKKTSFSCTAPQVDDNEIVATLSNILEFESGIVPNEQQLWHNNKLLQPRQISALWLTTECSPCSVMPKHA